MLNQQLEQSLAEIKQQEENTDGKGTSRHNRENFLTNILDKFQSIKLMDKVLFTRYLALLIRSGVPLSRSLGILKKQFNQPNFQKVIASLKKQIEEGQELSVSLKKYPRIFSDIYVNLVATGEVSGNLEQVLVPAIVLAEKVHYLKEGIQVKAVFYGESIFGVELPQFLEIMVVKTESATAGGTVKKAVLETGAKVDVPLFIESGDVIKIDTQVSEYIQRV